MKILSAIVAALALSGCAVRSARSIQGTWHFEPGSRPRTWIMINATGPNVVFTWPTGIGCQDEPATFHDRTLTVSGSNPITIRFLNRNRATISLYDPDLNLQRDFSLTKASNVTSMVCE